MGNINTHRTARQIADVTASEAWRTAEDELNSPLDAMLRGLPGQLQRVTGAVGSAVTGAAVAATRAVWPLVLLAVGAAWALSRAKGTDR